MSIYESRYTGQEIDEAIQLSLENITKNGHSILPSSSTSAVNLNQVTTSGAYTVEYYTNGNTEDVLISPIILFVYNIDEDVIQRYLSVLGWSYRTKDHSTGTWSSWKIQSFESSTTVVAATTGTGSAYIVNSETDYDTYATGDDIIIIPHITSTTTTPTLNVNSLGAIPLKFISYEGATPISDGLYVGWIEKDMPIKATYYNGTFLVQKMSSSDFGHDDLDDVNTHGAAWALVKGKKTYLKSHASLIDIDSSDVATVIADIKNNISAINNELYQETIPDFTSQSNMVGSSLTSNTIVSGGNVFVIATTAGLYTFSAKKTPVNLSTYSTGKSWTSVIYGCGRFIAVASDCTVVYSDDGITWKTSVLNSLSLTPLGLVYGNGVVLLLPTAGTSNYYMYSTNGGVDWHSSILTVNMKSATLNASCYGNGKFVCIGSSSTKIFTSTDGLNWLELVAPSSIAWKSVIYSNGKFVAIASSSASYMYSTDGTTWTAGTLPSSSNWSDIVFGSKYFIVISATAGTGALYSLDGITWVSLSLPTSSTWSKISYGSGIYMVISSAAGFRNILTSDITTSEVYHELLSKYEYLAKLVDKVQTISNTMTDDTTGSKYRFGVDNGRPYIYSE